MITGVILLIVGFVWTFIGRLPGDISFKKGNFSFYFPIMTSIVVSIILSLIFFLIGKFR
ncbi:DUF2905 domain-containing protein [Virgibacillus sp. MG-45]|uniref:DUF2905 domain-containing protein n=1 Tax=Virgibacillus sp. MG-45 TaxID=3102791 RepID=UPI003FCDCC28